MNGRITIETSGEVATVAKRAEGTRARARLAREADVLAAIAHPGVVRLVAYRTDEDRDELITEFAGASTLADHRPSDLAGVAGMGAAVADTLADLHELGLAHGALQADHVVLGARRRPVLCSFSAASFGEDRGVDDVIALGQLVSEMLQGVPQSRLGADRRVRTSIADAASAAASGASTARVLAGRLAAVPGARIDDDETPVSGGPDPDAAELGGTRTWRHRLVQPDHVTPSPSRRTVVAAGVLLALVVVLLVAASTWRGGGELEERLVEPATPSPAPTTAPAPGPTPGAQCRTGLDVDGDGCGDDTEVIGRLVRHGEIWYEIGEPGDVVVLGHWSCAPLATPAVLRPATGELFVFDRWPAGDGSVSVVSTASVGPGATSLVLGEADGCDAPVTEAS